MSNNKDFTVKNSIVVGGTVDGRDLATDGTKLDGIEAGATNTAAPAITSDGVIPSLASGITGAEVRSLIGAGTSSFDGAYSSLTGLPTLGSLAALSSVNAATITDNSVGAAELNVTGNGTTSQYLRSDGDGTFTWSTPTDTNTTYTAGTGLGLAGTVFSIDSSVVTLTGSQTLTNKTLTNPALTNPALTGTPIEDVFALSGTLVSLEPDNGSIQTHTLTGNTTYSDGFSAGQAITLMIDDGLASTVTWPIMTWVNNGGAAPGLATTGYTTFTLWKVSTTLYGALVGDGS